MIINFIDQQSESISSIKGKLKEILCEVNAAPVYWVYGWDKEENSKWLDTANTPNDAKIAAKEMMAETPQIDHVYIYAGDADGADSDRMEFYVDSTGIRSGE